MKYPLLSALALVAGASASLACGTEASAQSAPDAQPAADDEVRTVLDEVIVTAQKRQQNVQDVGIAITAFSGEQLEALGVTDSAELIQITPGLRNPQSGGGFTSSFSMRGLSQSDFGASQEAPVALYIDEIYQSSQGASQFLLFDTARVEVLRGPQGTLFGRNATGGVVHFITERPSQEFGGYVQADVGSSDDRRLEAAVTAPLTETISARVSVAAHQRDPIVENRIGKNLWSADDYGVRAQLLFEPNEDFDFLLSARTGSRDIAGQPYAWDAALPTGFAGTGQYNPGGTDFFGFSEPDDDPFTVSADADAYHRVDVDGITATANWDFGWAALTSLTDYTQIGVDYIEDADLQAGEFYHFRGLFDVEQFSQEVRLAGETDRLNWVTGLYYLNVDGDYVQQALIADLGFAPAVLQDTTHNLKTESASVFGQVEYSFSPQFKGIFGARYIDESRAQNYLSQYKDASGAPVAFGSSDDLLRFVGDINENLYSIRSELDWIPSDDILVYVSYNRGVKSGGFSAPLSPDGAAIFIDPVTFDPAPTADSAMRYDSEVLHSYELGLKSTVLDGLARFNAAAFYYDYKDFQALNLQGTTSYLTNNDARLYGFDAELYLFPADGLNFVLGASYLDQVVYDIQVGAETLDRQIPYAPEWNLTAVARYEWDALGGRVAVQANANYVSDQYLGLTNADVLLEPGYTLASARASYTFPNDRVTVSAFVDNLTDEEYRTIAFDLAGFFGSVESQYGLPRMFGLSLKYEFGN